MARFHGDGWEWWAWQPEKEREKRIYWHSGIRQMSRNAQLKLLTLMLMVSHRVESQVRLQLNSKRPPKAN